MSKPLNQWKRVASTSGGTETYERPLGQTEAGFYWDSVFERTADILRDAEVEVGGTALIKNILFPGNLNWAWMTLKQKYPLLGATIQERSEGLVVFIVDPSRLSTSNPEEVYIEKLNNVEEVDRKIDRLLNGHSPLSNELLACLIILQRVDQPSRFHVLIHSAHCISDEIAHNTLLREFLQLLSDTSPSPPAPLVERLALSVATETLGPYRDVSPSRARWHRAIARTIMDNRGSGMTGGHTLPRTVHSNTTYTPAHSCSISRTFSQEETKQILQICRDNKLTFGSVLPILGQLAMARVQSKLYLQGKISSFEWEFRKTEPMINAGPLNLRPFADRQWHDAGGTTNASLAIGFYFYQLSVIPLGPAANFSPGDSLPGQLDMLSKARFFDRCRTMKQKILKYIRHPLFFDMNTVYLPPRLQRLQAIAHNWRSRQNEERHQLTPEEEAANGIVMNHGGATLGNLDAVLPWEYPTATITGATSEKSLLLVGVRSFLHCRPAELYLGASTFRHRLKFHIFWDGNVYDDAIVKEWLEELAEATRIYLI